MCAEDRRHARLLGASFWVKHHHPAYGHVTGVISRCTQCIHGENKPCGCDFCISERIANKNKQAEPKPTTDCCCIRPSWIKCHWPRQFGLINRLVEAVLLSVSEHIRTQQTVQLFYDKHACETQIQPLLNEFSALSHELIMSMTGKEGGPLAEAYWSEADIHQRLGDSADTFIEFNQRVGQFKEIMATLPDSTVIFGHGVRPVDLETPGL